MAAPWDPPPTLDNSAVPCDTLLTLDELAAADVELSPDLGTARGGCGWFSVNKAERGDRSTVRVRLTDTEANEWLRINFTGRNGPMSLFNHTTIGVELPPTIADKIAAFEDRVAVEAQKIGSAASGIKHTGFLSSTDPDCVKNDMRFHATDAEWYRPAGRYDKVAVPGRTGSAGEAKKGPFDFRHRPGWSTLFVQAKDVADGQYQAINLSALRARGVRTAVPFRGNQRDLHYGSAIGDVVLRMTPLIQTTHIPSWILEQRNWPHKLPHNKHRVFWQLESCTLFTNLRCSEEASALAGDLRCALRFGSMLWKEAKACAALFEAGATPFDAQRFETNCERVAECAALLGTTKLLTFGSEQDEELAKRFEERCLQMIGMMDSPNGPLAAKRDVELGSMFAASAPSPKRACVA